MADMSWATLTGAQTASGSIRRLVNNPNIDVDEILEDAQAEIYSRLRVREMRSMTTLTGAQGLRYIVLPTDFLDPIALKDRYQCDVILTDPDALMNMWADNTDGSPYETDPSYFAIFDERIYFNVALDAAHPFSLIYFKKPAALSSGNQTNFLTNRYPHLMRAACRKYAYIFLKNSDEAKYAEAQLEKLLAAVAINDDLSNRGFVPLERGI